MSFRDEAYPHRSDRTRFPEILRTALADGQFNQIVNPNERLMSQLGRDPTATHGARCQNRPSGFLGAGRTRVCNMQPTPHDVLSVGGILDMWTRNGISDRYLDYAVVRTMNTAQFDRPESPDAAYERINADYPEGAVKYAFNVLSTHDSPDGLPIFGNAIGPDLTYNHVFSGLLVWDDMYCTGIIEWLQDQQARVPADGAERAIGDYVRAARRWVARAQRTPGTIYHRLGIGPR